VRPAATVRNDYGGKVLLPATVLYVGSDELEGDRALKVSVQ
jgi:hypothetical protein